MYGSDEFGADYYGEIPGERTRTEAEREWPPYTPQDRPGNSEWNFGGERRGRTERAVFCEELRREMEQAEPFYGPASTRILEAVREICGDIDWPGCTAIEGELTADILERLTDRVLSGIPDLVYGEEAAGLIRELVRVLVCQELIRRRARRRRRGGRI